MKSKVFLLDRKVLSWVITSSYSTSWTILFSKASGHPQIKPISQTKVSCWLCLIFFPAKSLIISVTNSRGYLRAVESSLSSKCPGYPQ